MTCSLHVEIVRAVADARGVDPTELEWTLNDYIDLEAVNQLAEREDSSWTLTFQLPGRSVTVTSDGVVHVTDE